MRFMVIRKADKDTEAGMLPSEDDFGPTEAVQRMREMGFADKK